MIDLYYPVPPNVHDADDLVGFDFLWQVTTPTRVVSNRTHIDRLEAAERADSTVYVTSWGPARPDLARAEQFLVDFGLTTVSRTEELLYLRGTGNAPYCYRVHLERKPRFVGLGLAVATRADLERLAKLPGVTPIERAAHPGGGDRVVLHDPAGFVVEVVHGETPVFELPHRDRDLAPCAGNGARLIRYRR